MSEQKPSVGRIVHYVLSEHDANTVNHFRKGTQRASYSDELPRDGGQVHTGNGAAIGDVLPMIITRVFGPQLVNGQVMLDGNDSLWVTSVCEGGPNEPDTWHWPARV